MYLPFAEEDIVAGDGDAIAGGGEKSSMISGERAQRL